MPVVLDVATLRSARQILAGPETRRDDGQFVGLDITALGSLVDAVCFSDEIHVPDLEHQSLPELARELGDAVRPVPLESEYQAAIADRARRWLADWSNLENLIRVLGGDPVYRMTGSTYQYLLLQAIGVRDKYDSAVVRWVRQLRDADRDRFKHVGSQGYTRRKESGGDGKQWELVEPPTTLSSENPGINAYMNHVLDGILSDISLPSLGIGPHPEIPVDDRWISHPSDEWRAGSEVFQFCANLAWTAFRTVSYGLYAAANRKPYMPHPLRARVAGFAGTSLADGSIDSSGQVRLTQLYMSRLEEVYEEATNVASSVGATAIVRFPYASVLPYVIRRAGTRARVLEATYELRDSRGARNLRKRIADFEQMIGAGDLEAAIKLRNELDEVTRTLRQRLGLERHDPPRVSFSVSAGFASASISPRGGLARMAKLPASARKPWLLVLWNVFDALAAADALGDLYEVLYDKRSEG